MNYYNENDPKAVAWLRELIAQGHIANGFVDERSIENISPGDLDGYVQCHFFAGIGGWSYALRLAGWPDDRPAWTGSCPCQPFSGAGQGRGTDDERHLWPAFRWLIAQCRPAVCFGEQVASAAGRQWLTGVRADLEAMEYAVGAADLCAAGVGAPHIRQRLFWVADSGCEGLEGRRRERNELATGGMVNSDSSGPSARDGHVSAAGYRDSTTATGGGMWTNYDVVWCRDPRHPARGYHIPRCIEPGTFPLAHGVPARVGRLRGYGNSIVPEVAAAFIQAIEDIT